MPCGARTRRGRRRPLTSRPPSPASGSARPDPWIRHAAWSSSRRTSARRFRDIPLAAELADAEGLPAFLDRDTNVAALGEHRFGAARDCDDFIYLTVSTGVGGAIVVRRLAVPWSGRAGRRARACPGEPRRPALRLRRRRARRGVRRRCLARPPGGRAGRRGRSRRSSRIGPARSAAGERSQREGRRRGRPCGRPCLFAS